jgi:2-methylisocitrate lyase-like PEP mutase family enzyme
MLDLIAQSLFEATRLIPDGNAVPASRTFEGIKMETLAPIDPFQCKRAKFAELHSNPGAFLMPNAWDAGSARLLENLGFQALATTSAGLAFSLGVRDSSASLSRAQVIDNAGAIAEATSLPVSADLEDGFGATPEDCAFTIHHAGKVGLCGGAIEDATGDPDQPIYEFDLAVDRIRAAVEAKPHSDFLVTARAESFLYDRPDLKDTIHRLQAFEEVGADVVYAPGLPDIETVRHVCGAVSIPVNVVVGLGAATFTVDDLSAVGVRRISTGGSLARAALGEMVRAASELKKTGTCDYAAKAISDADAAAQMRQVSRTSI